jgi:hypothetical protein
MTTSNGVVGRLRSLGVQLRRMIDGASFVRDGYVRVLDPGYLVSQLDEAADALDAAEAQVTRLTDALRPFAVDRLPSTKPSIIDYNRHGLRCAMSPMEVAQTRAFRALEDNPSPANTSTGE